MNLIFINISNKTENTNNVEKKEREIQQSGMKQHVTLCDGSMKVNKFNEIQFVIYRNPFDGINHT